MKKIIYYVLNYIFLGVLGGSVQTGADGDRRCGVFTVQDGPGGPLKPSAGSGWRCPTVTRNPIEQPQLHRFSASGALTQRVTANMFIESGLPMARPLPEFNAHGNAVIAKDGQMSGAAGQRSRVTTIGAVPSTVAGGADDTQTPFQTLVAATFQSRRGDQGEVCRFSVTACQR